MGVLFLLLFLAGFMTFDHAVGFQKFQPATMQYFPQPTVRKAENESRSSSDGREIEENVDTDDKQLWPANGVGWYEVPFDFNDTSEYSLEQYSFIYWAMQSIMRGSNVMFRPRVEDDNAYIHIKHVPGKCSSELGYKPGRRRMQLDKDQCFSVGVLQHVLLHALGFKDGDDTSVNYAQQKDPLTSRQIDVSSILAASDKHKVALSSCDWNLLNTKYPGEKPPPRCNANETLSFCEPTKDCAGTDCKTICTDDCDANFGTKCQYVDGERFPRDAVYAMGFTGEWSKMQGLICTEVRRALVELKEADCNYTAVCQGQPASSGCQAASKAINFMTAMDSCRVEVP